MKKSSRARRMARHHGKHKAVATLNLTSLMDIFTILVFFLMVNQSEVEVQNTDSVELPVSVSENKPEEQLTVLVTETDLLVQGRSVAQLSAIKQGDDEIIPSLLTELEYQASRTPIAEGEDSRPVTIVGDKATAYSVLKRIMSTCAESGFANISLAVNQKQPGGE